MSKSQKRRLRQILISAALFLFAMIFPFDKVFDGKAAEILPMVIYLAAYLLIGGNVLLKAARNIAHGQVFDENFLMAAATVGAMALGEYSEGVAVMLFYQIGELFQSVAVGKSRKSITDLMDIRPDTARSEERR